MDDNFSNLNAATLPSGGTAGQVLTKDTTTDYDVSWQTATPSLTDLVSDTTPQLGGNLDVNGNSITSASNANVEIAPNGTGDVYLTADTIRVGDNNTNATITTYGTGDLILNTNSGSNSGAITIQDGLDNDITVVPAGTGKVHFETSETRVGINNTNTKITTKGTGDLTLDTNSGSNSGSITIQDGISGTINISPIAGNRVLVGNGANTAIVSSSGFTTLRLETNSGGNSGSIVLNPGTASNINITSPAFGNININPNGGSIVAGNGANTAVITSNGFTALRLDTNAGSNSGSIVLNPGTSSSIDITSPAFGNINLNSGLGKVAVGNGANIATMTSSGPTILRLETNSGSNSGSIQLANGLSGNITLESGAFGKVLVGNAIFANTAIISSSGSQSLTLNTSTGNTASVVLQSGPSGNIVLESAFGGRVTLANQLFGNTAILSSSGSQSLTLNTSSGNTASVTIQSGASANILLETGFAGRVTVGNQIGGNVAILSSASAFPLTLNTNSGNTASVTIQNGPSANIQLQTGFGGRVTIDNQIGGNVAILSSSGAFPLTLNTNAGNTASIVLQNGPTGNVVLETAIGGKVTIGNQLFGNVAILSSAGAFPLTLNSGAGNTASIVLQNGPTGNVVLETAFGGRVTVGNQLFGNVAIVASAGAFPLTLTTGAGNTASVKMENGPAGNIILETAFAGKVLIGNALFNNAATLSTNGEYPLTIESQTDIILEPTGKTLINKPILTKPVYSIGTASGTQTPDATNGEWQTITLNGNLTLNAFSSPADGQTIKLIIKQDATGSRTLTSSMKWEGGSKTLSTAANAVDIASIYYDGTNYWASLTKGYA
jgi:hypothetical protein